MMDADDSMNLPVTRGSHLTEGLVGLYLVNYDYVVSLAHFKGHDGRLRRSDQELLNRDRLPCRGDADPLSGRLEHKLGQPFTGRFSGIDGGSGQGGERTLWGGGSMSYDNVANQGYVSKSVSGLIIHRLQFVGM
jgi:hypothetical protein